MDVVPAVAEQWGQDTCAATLTDGCIVGYGTQDIKCVSLEYLISVEHLKMSSFAPVRDVVMTRVPDEGIGNKDGIIVLPNYVWRSQL